MAKQTINIGTSANSGTGDPLRSAFTKTNANFTELYTAVESIPSDVSDLTDTEGLLGGGSGSGDTLTNSTQTFSLNETGNVVLSGDTGGVNRGLVWDYGAESGGQNSTVRQDVAGLSVRAYTEVGEGEEVYSAPVNIVTNEAENEKVWRFSGDGNLALPDGGSITEGIVTDNPTIELTPSNPSVESQKLVIKGGGGYYAEANGIWINLSNITFQVGDTVNAYIGAETYAGQTLYWRIVADEEVVISDPGEGTITLDESGLGDFSFVVDNDEMAFFVIVSPTENVYDPETIGVASLTINGDVGDHHLHLTTGDLSETSIFLGTDELNVRTTTNGTIQITTPTEGSNVWEFGTNGNLTLPQGGDIVDSNGDSVLGGGEGLPTITIPATPVVLYKGLQASYGVIHSNSDVDELNVNKIVIHKPAVTTTTIHPTSSQDDFQVSGIGASDVVAMFIIYGDVNGAKPLSDLQAFAEEVIDLVILDGGVEGDYNTVDTMKTAFYSNYETLASAANGLYTNFNFFTSEEIWPENSISDGGADQYDTGNFINTNLAQEINYNNGETVVDGTAAFGPGSTYSFVYDTAIFGVFATGSSATLIRTSGNSGADGGSTTEAGNLFGEGVPEQIFDNAVTHLNLVGTPYAGSLITFTRTDYGDEVDEISEGLHITKDDQGWLYNALENEEHGDDTPTGSLWNNDGWDDFGNVETRTYTSLSDIWGGNFANIPGAKMIMLDTTTDKYWAIEFLSWTNNNQGGGASYTRQELDLDNLQEGIRFSDGTRQTTAYVPTNVKLTSPGNRRIEEVAGYKQVEVTAKSTVNLTGTASRNSEGQAIIWIGINTTTIDEILSDTTAAGITNNSTVQFSVDNTTWYVFDGGTSFTSSERGYGINLNGATLTYNQGDTIYFRYQTGGAPQVWWDSDDLPSGSSNFRGAVIDYHAYIPGEGTIVGTIYTVDDDGDRHITHTEVSSGSSDLENSDLWNQVGEGEIRYRRIDGESSTLKIQWTAKVFYGSEYYND